MFNRDKTILPAPLLHRQNGFNSQVYNTVLVKMKPQELPTEAKPKHNMQVVEKSAPALPPGKRKREEKLAEFPKQARLENKPLFKPSSHLTYSKREKRMQKKMAKQQLTINKLKSQVQQFQTQQLRSQNEMNETLSEKLLKHIQSRSSENKSYTSITDQEKIIDVAGTTENYSQITLLKKINRHLTSRGEAKISEEGHCHGITLLWLTMMSWRLESLFYKLVRQIAKCPDSELSAIDKEIMTFMEWIDLGQSPEKYSNNICNQQDVDKIIGVKSIDKIASQEMTEDELATLLHKVSHDENSMATITGWRDVEDIDHTKKTKTTTAKGHTVGLFFKNNTYCLYDCNYQNGQHKVIPFANKTATEARYRLFNVFKSTPSEKSKYSLNIVTQQLPRPAFE